MDWCSDESYIEYGQQTFKKLPPHGAPVFPVMVGLVKLSRVAFSVAGPTTWNSLTDSLRDPSLYADSFLRQLITFFVCFQIGPCVFSAISPVFIQTQSLALASSQSWLPLLQPSIPIGWRLRLLRETTQALAFLAVFVYAMHAFTQRKRLHLNGNRALWIILADALYKLAFYLLSYYDRPP